MKRLRVMLAAHMDEIGFMLTHDDGDGIFRFDTVGAAWMLASCQVSRSGLVMTISLA